MQEVDGAWRGQRAAVIQRDFDLCQRSGRHGQIEPPRLCRDRGRDKEGNDREPKQPHVTKGKPEFYNALLCLTGVRP